MSLKSSLRSSFLSCPALAVHPSICGSFEHTAAALSSSFSPASGSGRSLSGLIASEWMPCPSTLPSRLELSRCFSWSIAEAILLSRIFMRPSCVGVCDKSKDNSLVRELREVVRTVRLGLRAASQRSARPTHDILSSHSSVTCLQIAQTAGVIHPEAK